MAMPTEAEEVTTRLVLLVLAATIVVVTLSIYYIYGITHNAYAAGYFTLASLFDFSTVTGSSVISAYAPLYSSRFFGLFAIAIIDGLAKAVLIGFVIAAFINALMALDLRSRIGILGTRNATNKIIIAGYSQLAERLVHELLKRKMHFVIIEKSQEKADMLADAGYPVVIGDMTKDETYESIRIAHAKAIVLASDNEYTNLLGVITVHHRYPELRIITKASLESTATKMHRAGAELCIVPEVLAGIDMGLNILKAMAK
ncbi:MAG: NAD-binding protein [Candidatus Micrarchaeia archaeon]